MGYTLILFIEKVLFDSTHTHEHKHDVSCQDNSKKETMIKEFDSLPDKYNSPDKSQCVYDYERSNKKPLSFKNEPIRVYNINNNINIQLEGIKEEGIVNEPTERKRTKSFENKNINQLTIESPRRRGRMKTAMMNNLIIDKLNMKDSNKQNEITSDNLDDFLEKLKKKMKKEKKRDLKKYFQVKGNFLP